MSYSESVYSHLILPFHTGIWWFLEMGYPQSSPWVSTLSHDVMVIHDDWMTTGGLMTKRKPPYVPSSKHGIRAMVIHPIFGINTMGILNPIDGCMTIPFYEKTNHVLTRAHMSNHRGTKTMCWGASPSPRCLDVLQSFAGWFYMVLPSICIN